MAKPLVCLVAVFGCLALVASGADAALSKCSAAKFKGAGKKAYKRANCYYKAVKKGEPVDGDCLTKVSEKFDKAFVKAEEKGDCLTLGDAAAIETDTDNFVDQIRSTVNGSAGGPSTCDAKKIKFTGKKAYAKSKCHHKALRKNTAVDPACLLKAEEKFNKAIAKAEAGDDCTNTGQTVALEAVVDNYIDALEDDLVPPPTTTTTTSTTSTTTIPTTSTTTTTNTTTTTTSTTTTTTTTNTTTTTAATKIKVTTVFGTANCGGAGLTTLASAPLSGELDSNTACTTKLNTCGTGSQPCDLGLACLYFGGGNGNTVPPGKIPEGATTYLALPTPTTIGASVGTSPKDCSLSAGPGKHCVNNNAEPVCTADLDCGGLAGSCALDANCFFGPPLPILSPIASLTTCVMNVIQTGATGTINQGTGASSVSLPLSSRVYITGNTASPCPKCISGTCDASWKTNVSTFSPDTGDACTTTSVQLTTIDCRPALTGFQAPLPVSLSPLTTGTATLTSATGLFCPSQTAAGAFGQGGARCVKETGSPATGLSGGGPVNAKQASVFCISATGNAAVDGVADLPGPGAIGLNTTADLE